MNSETHASESILAGPPNLNADDVANAVSLQFGLIGDFTELVSERDRNYRLTASDGRSYVVKATCQAEDAIVTDFQIEALIHLENRGVTGVPRIVRTPSGQDRGVIRSVDGSDISLRVVTWLSGKLLSDVEVTAKIAGSFGARLAELNLAFRDFSHEGEAQSLLWDSQRAGELRGLLSYIDEKATRNSIEDVLDDFEARVKPVLGDLPNQVIHNDANDENVLLDSQGEVSGIIDFGDMMRAPRVVDPATAASYLRTQDDPLGLIEPFVVAYHQKNALLDAEFEVLFDLIRTRLSMTLTFMYWRLAARDSNDPYRQKTLAINSNALSFLQNLSKLGRASFRKRFKT
jgi:hydroxylysine kinase